MNKLIAYILIIIMCLSTFGANIGNLTHSIVHLIYDGSFHAHEHITRNLAIEEKQDSRHGHNHNHDHNKPNSHAHSFNFILQFSKIFEVKKTVNNLQHLTLLMLTLDGLISKLTSHENQQKIYQHTHKIETEEISIFYPQVPIPPPKRFV